MKNNLYKKIVVFMLVFLLLTNFIFPIVYATGEEDIEFTDSKFENAIVDNGKDSNWESIDKDENGKISQKEMEELFEISLDCNEISSIEELKYAKNIKILSLYNYERNFSLSVIKQLTGLLNFDISGNNVLVSDITDVVSSFTNLESLGVGLYNENGLDIEDLVPICGNVSELNLSGNIKNISALAKMPKLKSLNLRNYSETPSIDEIINVIKNIQLTDLYIGSEININLGSFQEGDNVIKNFSEISPVMEYVFDKDNILYSPESKYYSGNENIQVDNNNKTVTILTNSVGEQYSNIYCNDGKFCGNIYLRWKTISQGDTETEIPIPDNNLKQMMLNNYDVDGNGKITEIDIKSINSLWIGGSVTNLEGLQYMTNLRELSIDCGYQGTIDITPILGLKNLERVYISNNNIRDISFLQNFEKLNYANLTRNPINPEEINNKNTIAVIEQRGGHVELSEYDTTPNIVFVNQDLRKEILRNPGNDINKDGEISEYEMSQIYSLSNVYGNLEDLKYATNLANLYMRVTKENNDLSKIFELKTLRSLSINFYGTGIDDEITVDLSEIAKLTNLQELTLGGAIKANLSNLPNTITKIGMNSNNYLDMKEISGLTNINSLTISSNKIENVSEISKLTQLTNLYISIGTSYSENGENISQILDLSNLEKLTKLRTLDISGKMSNLQSLKKLTNLTQLRLSPNNPTDVEITDILNVLNQLNVQEISLSGSYNVNLGNFNFGSNQEAINIKDLNAITNAIYTKESKIYIENPNWQTYSQYGQMSIGNTISIDTSKVGQNGKSIFLSGYNSRFSGHIYVTWNVVEDGDKTKEINIPDENFKRVLLERYDIDNNDKITEYDLINITDMDLGMSDIQSLEGIQNCKNLKTLYAMDNRISDLSPIVDMENISFASFERNIIQNIDCLESAKIPLSRIDITQNYIDTSKGSNAYNILKNSYINEIKNDEELSKYANDSEILEQIDSQIVYSQNYGSYEERNLEVPMEEAMKQKLIELGLDRDHNGKLTREELYHAQNEIYELNLSGLGITDLSPLKYINLYYVDLSNNNITDISELANTKFSEVNLSNNKISNINVLEDMHELCNIDLSNNNISNITVLVNIPYIKYKNRIYIVQGEKIYIYSVNYGTLVDLTQNYIDVNATNNKNTLEAIDMDIHNIKLENQKAKPDRILGDVSGDGTVNAKDLNMLYAHINGTKKLNDEQLMQADVTGEGEVTAKDLNRLYAHVNGTKPLN